MGLQDFKAEVEKALNSLSPEIEGLNDFMSVNLGREAQTAVSDLKQVYERRRDALSAVLETILVLENDGYPKVLTKDVSLAVYSELNGNLLTMTAAFGQFHTKAEAVSGEVVFSDPT